jgi:glycine oxidase
VAAEQRKPDVAVVGAGPIGLAAAWRAAQRGLSVCVLDAGEPGAWHAAAGMLAPISEVAHGEEALLELGLRAARGYPGFCAELAEASGEDPALRSTGTLIVARDADDAAVLDRLHELHHRLGLAAERLLPTRARRAEPALAPTVRLAIDVPGDHSVDPRRLVAALTAAVRGAGGVVRAHARVEAVTAEHGRVSGVELEDGERIAAGAVVLAAGAHAGALGELPVRPVKGQVLRLRDPNGPGLIGRTVRTPDAYLVPRADGRYVLGATMEERGFDTAPTAGGVFELLRDLSEVVPGVLELELEGVLAGLRPATPDNLPAVGPGALDGLVWATGHHRNGILLADLTGELVAATLAGEERPEWAQGIDPRRFAQVPA